MPLLVPGSTCWKKALAERLSLIQDAGPTYAAMATAIEAARHTVFIVGWDLDSRTVLRPEATDPYCRTLLPLLCRCLERRPELHIYVLIWDFSWIYSFEREPRPRRQFGRAHPRLHFSLDDTHGTGGSHHQKVVVVDDEVAFVGGIDLTLHRWDTPAHAPVDPRRADASGTLYDPFHEVHAAVSGPAAVALGELARQRWEAGPRRPVPPPLPASSPARRTGASAPRAWPADLPVDASNVEIGLARTLVRVGEPTVKEVEKVTLKAIAMAQRWIYAENQYLTSGAITRALGKLLAADQGPEIVVVLPEAESGWKEKSSMGILREEALAYLLKRDKHGRLRLVTPVVAQDGITRRVSVHAKVLVIDDTVAKIGSSNFSNRSMGLDSECDLIVEASDEYDVPENLGGDDRPHREEARHQGLSGGARSRAFVASVRNRLLGEHLGLSGDEVAARLASHGSLLRLVDEHPISAPRALLPTPVNGEHPFDFTALDGAMVDPPEPWSANLLLERAVPVPLRRRLARRWLRPAALVAAVLVGWAILNHFDPNAQRLHASLMRFAHAIADRRAGVFIAIAFYAIAGALFVPVTLLATATLTVFGLWPGVAVAWAGGVLGATISHAVGSHFEQRAMAWIPDRIGTGLRRFLSRRAFWSVVFMRLLPLGNFGVLNIVAGAVKVPRRSFILGNMLGLLPGLLGLGVVVDRLLAMLRQPTLLNVVTAVLLLALVILLGIWAKRRFASREAARQAGAAGDSVVNPARKAGMPGGGGAALAVQGKPVSDTPEPASAPASMPPPAPGPPPADGATPPLAPERIARSMKGE